MTGATFLTREEGFLGTDLLVDLERGFSVFFNLPALTSSSVSLSSSSSSSSFIGTTLFFATLEGFRVVVDFAGGARGSVVSSMISCIADRLRPRVDALRVGAVDVREFGFEEDAERDFVVVEVLGGGEDPEKNAQPALLRFRCSSLWYHQ